jgi:hypothetical protein
MLIEKTGELLFLLKQKLELTGLPHLTSPIIAAQTLPPKTILQ